ncbi:nucleoredoxin isoform X2 [Tupaia chinensis]|uniref:nucleoredoxin isoform X2 n=1 Tax=Tupaia chinensis TaxID=246437 RepID=UPI0003C8E5E3|nr:nucleoredoxin isoform X2 [Tupaia chinensis]
MPSDRPIIFPNFLWLKPNRVCAALPRARAQFTLVRKRLRLQRCSAVRAAMCSSTTNTQLHFPASLAQVSAGTGEVWSDSLTGGEEAAHPPGCSAPGAGRGSPRTTAALPASDGDRFCPLPLPVRDGNDGTYLLKLWNKYRISNIPSLIFLDATTGKVVCRNGLLVIRDDPEGLEFPWGPKPFREVIAGPLLRNNGQSLESSSLEGSHVGVYFSAHWCPPCRSLTRVLVESYRKIKEAGQKFEIIFVSADRSEESFKQYFSEMPWLAVPYTDEARRSRLNRLYGIQGIPTLIVLDPQGELITRQGRVEVLNDEDCREFPWHPKPVLELSDSNAVQLNEGPCLVLFVDSEDDGESEAAKQLIQPIAEKIIAKYKAKEEEAPLLFFVAGEDDMTDSLRDYTNLPEAAPLLTILDMSARAKYVMDVEEITPAIVEAFVNDFLAEKLKPEPI